MKSGDRDKVLKQRSHTAVLQAAIVRWLGLSANANALERKIIELEVRLANAQKEEETMPIANQEA